MSALTPFVASVLYDKVLAETKHEVDNLSEQLQKSQAVQIISASGAVYAEGQFQDGHYCCHIQDLWLVNLTEQFASCRLSDLTGVEICIGGISKAHFGAGSIPNGYCQGDEATYVDGLILEERGDVGYIRRWAPFPLRKPFSAKSTEISTPS
jgi:hypothetical protein